MPLLQRLSKRVGCRIWDAIKAKLKAVLQKEKIDKTLVDYIFVLFDPSNDTATLRSKLVDFLGDRTDPFVEWFTKVISQVDNQVAKAQAEVSAGATTVPAESNVTENLEGTNASNNQNVTSDTVPTSDDDRRLNQHEFEASKIDASENDWEDEKERESKKHDEQKKSRGSSRATKNSPSSRGVSRMLNKAARDAVKSVQQIGGSSAATSDEHRDALQKLRATSLSCEDLKSASELPEARITASADVLAEKRSKEMSPETNKDETLINKEIDAAGPKTIAANRIASPVNEGQLISVTIGRKRTSDGRHVGPTRNPAATMVVSDSNMSPPRSQGRRPASPLIVSNQRPEEAENVQEEDPSKIPGLLIVMPAQSSDHLSHILMGDEEMDYQASWPMMTQRDFEAPLPMGPVGFSGSMSHFHKALQPPRQNLFVTEAESEEKEFSGPPTKRLRPGAQARPLSTSQPALCKFLPHCVKKAGICPFYHPPCRNGKYCRYGATCVFNHSTDGTAKESVGAGPARILTKIPFCIYAPFCTQPRCKFLHKQPIMCTFASACRMGADKCAFLHKEDLADSKGKQSESFLPSPDAEELHIADYDDEDDMDETTDAGVGTESISSNPDELHVEPTFP